MFLSGVKVSGCGICHADPGYEPGSGEEDGGPGLTHALLVLLLWFLVALVLFLFR